MPLFSEKCNLPFRGQRALIFLLALSKVGNLGHKAHGTVEGAHCRDLEVVGSSHIVTDRLRERDLEVVGSSRIVTNRLRESERVGNVENQTVKLLPWAKLHRSPHTARCLSKPDSNCLH